MLQGKARIKEQGTFRERKAARIAKGQVKYEFRVYLESWRFRKELIATFKSRKEAEKFAFEQRGPIVGYSLAVGAVSEKRTGIEHILDMMVLSCDDFRIERVEIAQ